MPENVHMCPFSGSECKSCLLYRGRHNYIMCKDGEQIPRARILNRIDVEWQERFKEVIENMRGDDLA